MTITKLRILVVDDERISRETTVDQCIDAGWDAVAAANASEGLTLLQGQPFNVVLTDLRMPGMDGLELLDRIKEIAPTTDVIIMTAYGTVETAIAAMQAGAADYLTKPFRFPELQVRLERLTEIRESKDELSRLQALLDGTKIKGLVFASASMNEVCQRVRLFADNSIPTLLTGETGTGKEVVSRVLHDLSSRRQRPFVPISCGAIPKELAESQIFGHEKGAYTGATQRRRGCFERAHTGTLLLDDIDDLDLEIQAKLLRVLQEATVVRVGGDEPIRVDVRVIATTKIDLAKAVKEGGFRDDLYYRLRGLEIHLPPLRERGNDVLLLVQYFLRAAASSNRTQIPHLAPKTIDALRNHHWPGNVRELRRVIESAMALSQGGAIELRHLPQTMTSNNEWGPFRLNLDGVEQVQLTELMRRFEREVLSWAMRKMGGSQTQAAELLGIPRTSLQSKLVRRDSGKKLD